MNHINKSGESPLKRTEDFEVVPGGHIREKESGGSKGDPSRKGPERRRAWETRRFSILKEDLGQDTEEALNDTLNNVDQAVDSLWVGLEGTRDLIPWWNETRGEVSLEEWYFMQDLKDRAGQVEADHFKRYLEVLEKSWKEGRNVEEHARFDYWEKNRTTEELQRLYESYESSMKEALARAKKDRRVRYPPGSSGVHSLVH